MPNNKHAFKPLPVKGNKILVLGESKLAMSTPHTLHMGYYEAGALAARRMDMPSLLFGRFLASLSAVTLTLNVRSFFAN